MADLDVPKSEPAPINLVPILKCEFFHGSHDNEYQDTDQAEGLRSHVA